MNNEQLELIENIRRAVNQVYDQLNITLYDKKKAVKVTYDELNPSTLIEEHLQYIVRHLNELRDSGDRDGE